MNSAYTRPDRSAFVFSVSFCALKQIPARPFPMKVNCEQEEEEKNPGNVPARLSRPAERGERVLDSCVGGRAADYSSIQR